MSWEDYITIWRIIGNDKPSYCMVWHVTQYTYMRIELNLN